LNPAKVGCGTSAKAAITGDFVLIASEVDPVMKTLRQNAVEVTALHSQCWRWRSSPSSGSDDGR